MTNIKIGKNETIHYIGIGGIGMSGLAQIMKIMGFNVQGSDLAKNKNSDNCKKIGIKIMIGHVKKNISKATIIVKSTAIKNNNVELLSSKKKKIANFRKSRDACRYSCFKKKILLLLVHMAKPQQLL